MTVLETVALYYDAWQNQHGDFREVPLSDEKRRLTDSAKRPRRRRPPSRVPDLLYALQSSASPLVLE
jgi:hypothetical protein